MPDLARGARLVALLATLAAPAAVAQDPTPAAAAAPPRPRFPAALLGQVTHAKTGEPIGGAQVFVAELDTTLVSDETGSFRLAPLPPGKYVVLVRAIGFRAHGMRVELADSAALDVQVKLQAGAQLLPDLTTSARYLAAQLYANGFYDRANTGRGRFFTQQDIQQRGQFPRASDALRSLGLDVDCPQFNQCTYRWNRCLLAFVINGIPQRGIAATQNPLVANSLFPEDIAAFEVYYSDIPAEFRQFDERCTLVVWTGRMI